MVFVKSWDESNPAGSRSISLGDNDIRDFKYAIRERLQEDHNFFDSEAAQTNVGLHKKTSLINQSNPTNFADMLILFAKDAAAKSELHSVHEDGIVSQLTYLGKLWVSALKVASETNKDLIRHNGSVWTRYAWTSFIADLIADSDFLSGTAATAARALSGSVIQTQFFRDGAYATGTSLTDYDDSIPQLSEMDKYMELAFTPLLSTSRLLIFSIGNFGSNNDVTIVEALFQDAQTQALTGAVTMRRTTSGSHTGPIPLLHLMNSPGTGTYTFKLYAASATSPEGVAFNGRWGGAPGSEARMGGAYDSFILIMEIK